MDEASPAILVVDDNDDNRYTLTRRLRRLGYDNFDNSGPIKRGLGMTCLQHGSGIPGVDMAAASIKLNDDGSFNLLVGATDIGTGSDTILSQIAAEALSVPLEKIVIYSSDTDMTPFDKGAYASSTTFISGMSVKKACDGVVRQLKEAAMEMWRHAGERDSKLEELVGIASRFSPVCDTIRNPVEVSVVLGE